MSKVSPTRFGSTTRGDWRRSWAVIAVSLFGSLAFLAGCGPEEGSADAAGAEKKREVAALEVGNSLYSPVWDPGEDAVFALSRGGELGHGQLVKVKAGEDGFDLNPEASEEIASAQDLEGAVGENLALEKGNEPDKIYVPMPGKEQVAVYDKDDLLAALTFDPLSLVMDLMGLARTAVAVVTVVIVLLVAAVYMAMKPGPIVEGSLRLIPEPARGRAGRVLEDLRATLTRWLGGRQSRWRPSGR